MNSQTAACLPAHLVLDMSDVTFMDSSGIAVLLRALARNNALKTVRPKKTAPSAANTESGKETPQDT